MYFTSQLILSASQISLPLSHALWPPKQSVRDYATEVINFIDPSHISTCRAVWVPGQDLATLHLTRNCGKRILSLQCTLYIHLCMHMLYAGLHVRSLWYEYAWFETTWAMPGYAILAGLFLTRPPFGPAVHVWRRITFQLLLSISFCFHSYDFIYSPRTIKYLLKNIFWLLETMHLKHLYSHSFSSYRWTQKQSN